MVNSRIKERLPDNLAVKKSTFTKLFSFTQWARDKKTATMTSSPTVSVIQEVGDFRIDLMKISEMIKIAVRINKKLPTPPAYKLIFSMEDSLSNPIVPLLRLREVCHQTTLRGLEEGFASFFSLESLAFFDHRNGPNPSGTSFRYFDRDTENFKSIRQQFI
jgi:hypothetical protein